MGLFQPKYVKDVCLILETKFHTGVAHSISKSANK